MLSKVKCASERPWTVFNSKNSTKAETNNIFLLLNQRIFFYEEWTELIDQEMDLVVSFIYGRKRSGSEGAAIRTRGEPGEDQSSGQVGNEAS